MEINYSSGNDGESILLSFGISEERGKEIEGIITDYIDTIINRPEDSYVFCIMDSIVELIKKVNTIEEAICIQYVFTNFVNSNPAFNSL